MAGKAKTIAFLTLIFLMLAPVPGCREKTAPAQQMHTVRVLESARSPYFLPLYLALNLGFFKEQNLNVTISTASPEAIRTALDDGRTDIALCGLQKIIFNPNAKGPAPKVFATMACRDGSYLLERENKGEFNWENLKNKTIIGGSQDDSSEIALESVLRRHGLRPYREVTIYHNIPDTLRVGAFRAGTGHYLQLLEPEAAAAEAKGYGRVVESVGTAAGDMVVTAYAALPGYIESNPEIIQGFTNAIYKAQLWLSRHSPDEAAEAAAPSFPNTDRQVLLKSLKRYQSLRIWACSPVVPREPYERFHEAAKEAGEIALPAPYETAVVTDFARKAVETVTYDPETGQDKNLKNNIFGIFNRK
ncbi:ABC-type nitrate/sulfonate/bicarbonate transport system, periplasmic components [Pelotomaculum thermopropionicum SI]|uniref:ABC-type nitrate/sulfonate/bicarbonate transport system, periplasmic components n=1 Tax=Pelotomaculum thermopropionicum (strain DSM 13744 / JCM 10971 / SI) TaxID=370438 RepID=A5D452_PELTS|nr:ABC-type nitrate/sulfonate/bicarbonate transport system, periplasmic components [Pelotomaculum thermopropionicum SI]